MDLWGWMDCIHDYTFCPSFLLKGQLALSAGGTEMEIQVANFSGGKPVIWCVRSQRPWCD